MNLNLSPEAKAAIDLAKRSVSEEGELDSRILIPALYFAGNVADEMPELRAVALAALARPGER